MKQLAVICLFVTLSAFCQGTDAAWASTANRYQQRGSLIEPPKNLEVSEITLTSVKLTWSHNTPDEISYYIIYHRPRNTRQGYSQIPRITSEYYDVQNLSPYTEYEFIVAGVSNDNRRGYPSAPVIVTTAAESTTTWATVWDVTTEDYQTEAATQDTAWYYSTTERRQQEGLPGPPEDLRVSHITNSSVDLTWSYTGTDESLYYIIYYKPRYSSEPYSENSGIISTYHRVNGLSPNTEYVFLVVGINTVGRGLPSAPAFITTNRNEIYDGYSQSWNA